SFGPPTVSRFSGSRRKTFWNTNINFRTKNVWYQLLHNKVNIRLVLHHVIPILVPSPNCPLCPRDQLQDTAHMLIRCQRVRQIWKVFFIPLSSPPSTSPLIS
ncbi:hypothetical protein BDF21DRAFT_332639, partial [Thamnidium elegans]